MAREATFRVVRFPKLNRFVAIAWNYEQAVFISSSDHATYTEARAELDAECLKHAVTLKWFDGEYDAVAGEMLIPAELPK